MEFRRSSNTSSEAILVPPRDHVAFCAGDRRLLDDPARDVGASGMPHDDGSRRSSASSGRSTSSKRSTSASTLEAATGDGTPRLGPGQAGPLYGFCGTRSRLESTPACALAKGKGIARCRVGCHRAAQRRSGKPGDIVVAIGPVIAVVLASSQGESWTHRIIAVVVASTIWAVSMAIGHSLGGSALTALGPRVAVARGVLIAVVLSATASAWLPDAGLSPTTIWLLALIVFVAGACWETFALRKVTPAVRAAPRRQALGCIDLAPGRPSWPRRRI